MQFAEMTSAAKARQGLAIYFPLLIVGPAIVEWLIVRDGGRMAQDHRNLMLLLMWMPALSSAVARLVLREGFRDVSFRFGGKVGLRAVAFAILMPLIVGTVAYGIAWATGLVGFSAITPSPAELAMSPAAAWLAGLEPTSRFFISVGIVLHAAWNSIILNPFDRSSVGPGATFWIGESGVLVAVTTLIVGLVVYQWWRKEGAKLVKV